MNERTIRNRVAVASLIWLGILSGCNDSGDVKLQAKKPRPVEVKTLAMSAPPRSRWLTASVGSWKTENLAMEVGGRVDWVVEPNTEIEGRVVGQDGTVIIQGTPIAKIDDERFRLQVANAQAQVERAQQSIIAAKTDLKESIPAQIRAAESEKKLAVTEFERSKSLFDQKAGARADVDRDESRVQVAVANIEQLLSLQQTKKSDLESLKLALVQDQKSLRDAQRSLEDCTLYASFRGQISDVDVVQGSIVSSGQAVATLQMMDPIKIELEVSAEDSRRLRNRQRISVYIPDENGSFVEHNGFLYLIDPAADSRTRTFTVTILMLNKQVEEEATDNTSRVSTDRTWRLDLKFIPGTEEGKAYVSEDAIQKDAQGPFLWKVVGHNFNQSLPKDRILKVAKMRIGLGPARLPFLGNWVFKEVEILDETFDIKQHLVVGKLSISNGQWNQWDGKTVVLKGQHQWMVRPGDLVKLDLSDSEAERGLFVPMDSIANVAGKTYLFLVDENMSPPTAKRVEISIGDSQRVVTTSSMLRVAAVDPAVSLVGKKFVTRGTHYLRDGEPVNVVQVEGTK